MSIEASSTQERLRDRFPQLSGSEYKIASYIYGLMDKFGTRGVWMQDAILSKATGVSVRQVSSVRQSLVRQGLIETETVRGRGTCYDLPPLPASPGVEEPSSGDRDAVEVAPEPNAAPAQGPVVAEPMIEGHDGRELGAEPSFPSPPSAVVQAATPLRRDPGEMIDNPSPAPRPVSAAPPTQSAKSAAPAPRPQPTPHEEITALIAEMMEGEKPDRVFLQKLLELAGGVDNLRECLRWMVEQDDPKLFIRQYRFEAGPKGRDLFFRRLEYMLLSPESPLLKWRQAAKR